MQGPSTVNPWNAANGLGNVIEGRFLPAEYLKPAIPNPRHKEIAARASNVVDVSPGYFCLFVFEPTGLVSL